jgi:hypothetical protein
VIQLVVLVVSVLIVIAMVAAGMVHSRLRLVVHAVFALVVAVLLNVGTDLVITRGSVVGVACVLIAIGILAIVLLWRRTGAGLGGDHAR